MKELINYLLIFSFVIFIISCGDNNPVAPVENKPEITSIYPSIFLPYDTLTISGKYFGSTKDSSEVYFDSLKSLIYVNWSDNEIKLLVPEISSSGNLKVVVKSKASNLFSYQYDDSPQILTVVPAKAKVGDTIEIRGFSFGSSGIVQFNLAKAKDIISWSNNTIKVKVPEGAFSGDLIVISNNKYSKSFYFTVEEPYTPKYPIIYSLNPNSERIGREITIIGKNFGEIQSKSYVEFNGTKATEYSHWDTTSIKVKVPQNATSGPVTVFVDTMSSNSLTFSLKPDLPVPSIFSLSKTYFKEGEEITINGQNFGDSKTAESKVVFNGLDAVNYSLWQSDLIKVTVPAGTKNGKVYVVVEDKISNGVEYTIQEIQKPPIISSINPTIAQSGQKVTIYGSNLGTSAGENSFVMFGFYKAVVSEWSPTEITVIVPDMAAGLTQVYVTVDGVQSNNVTFTVQSKPEIIVEMVEIPAGSFLMGNSDPASGDAYPQHKVIFTKSLLVSKTEITQAQYKKVMNYKNPSRILDDKNPVEQVTFLDAVDFCNRLSKLEGYEECYTINGSTVTWNKSANGYRLMTESEWEYACRAGSIGNVGQRNGSEASIDAIAWTANNAKNMQHVGILPPNDFGLYDMQGNAAEWVWDFYDYYGEAETTNPTGPEDGVERCFRGGSYKDSPSGCYTYVRNAMNGLQSQYYISFRICRN